MTVREATKTEVKGYVQGPLQCAKFMDGTMQGNLGVKGGLQVEKKSFHAGGEVGVSPSLFQVRTEVGHKFRLNDNMNIDLVGLADYKSELGNRNRINLTYVTEFEDKKNQQLFESNNTYKAAWNNDVITLGAKAEAQYGTNIFKNQEYPKLNVGLGVEGGYRTTTKGDISFTSNVKHTANDGTMISDNFENTIKRETRGGYITPTASIELAASKNFSFVAKGDLYQGDFGIRYTF